MFHIYWLLWIRCHWPGILSVRLCSLQSRWSVISITAQTVLYYFLVNCLLLLRFRNKFLFLHRRSATVSTWYNRETRPHFLLLIPPVSSSPIELVLYVRCLFYRRCGWRYLIIERHWLFMLKHHLSLHKVFIIFLYSQEQLLCSGCAPLWRDAFPGVVTRRDSSVPGRILLQHTVEYHHIFLYRRQEICFLPREVLLRVNHVIIDESQHIIIHCLSVLLHMLPDLGHYRLQSLLHLIRGRVLSPSVVLLQVLRDLTF